MHGYPCQAGGKPFWGRGHCCHGINFKGKDNPDTSVVAAALEPRAASTQAYLVVTNDDVGFSVLHHLQQMDQEICPGDPIIDHIVAFKGDI